jgi:plasmid stabilization system protein ParE
MAEEKYRILYGDEIFLSFKEIHDYIARQSDDRAAATIEKLLDAIDGLVKQPHRYAEVIYKSIPYPVRRMVVWPYRILYWVDEVRHAVRIVRVEHGSRNTR